MAIDPSASGGDVTAAVSATPTRPLITPEPFTGSGSFSEWIEHFKTVAAINKWVDNGKLLWLRVRRVGGAQTAYGRLPADAKATFDALKKALKGRFEPEVLKERHLAEFQSRKKLKTEGWAEFADGVKLLSDKAYPDLEDKARECLALNHYLGQIDQPQVAFSVRQRQPHTLVEAVSATIEMESYLQPKASRVAFVEESNGGVDPVIGAIQQQQKSVLNVLDRVMERLEKLEANSREVTKPPTPGPLNRRAVICRICNREGHYARGCASLPLSTPPESAPHEAMSLLPVTHSYRLEGSVNGVPTSFVVDTGASIMVVDEQLWSKANTV